MPAPVSCSNQTWPSAWLGSSRDRSLLGANLHWADLQQHSCRLSFLFNTDMPVILAKITPRTHVDVAFVFEQFSWILVLRRFSQPRPILWRCSNPTMSTWATVCAIAEPSRIATLEKSSFSIYYHIWSILKVINSAENLCLRDRP